MIQLQYDDGQTPLEEEEKEGLLLPSVTTKWELDEVEQRNIEEAVLWTIARRKKFTADEVLSEKFILSLHNRMFSSVWEWAGTFRKTDKNLGVSKFDIATELRILIDDCKFWITHDTFSPDEVAIRFKHRLVSVHCFANGNGRHSRLMADIIIEKILGEDVFSWGGKGLSNSSSERTSYLTALHEADKLNYAPLISFARS